MEVAELIERTLGNWEKIVLPQGHVILQELSARAGAVQERVFRGPEDVIQTREDPRSGRDCRGRRRWLRSSQTSALHPSLGQSDISFLRLRGDSGGASTVLDKRLKEAGEPSASIAPRKAPEVPKSCRGFRGRRSTGPRLSRPSGGLWG